jgi:diguanylate cyclase (GGDEF)-like protein
MGQGGHIHMHSANLLVTDQSPETAERINSLLRNSGIRVHVLHARTCAEVKRTLDHDSPVLIVFANPEPEDATLEEVGVLADAFNIPLALFTDLEDPEKLAADLRSTACYVINSLDEGFLADAVSRLLKSSESERNQTQKQQHLEELEHRYNLVLDSARDAIAYVHEGLHVYTNKAYLDALHVKDASGLEGLSLLELLKPGEINPKKLFRDLSKGHFPDKPLDVTVMRPDGSEFDAQLIFSPARFDGEDCIQMMVQKADSASDLAAELERLRVMDPLTQLGNRKAFSDNLNKYISRSSSERANSTAAVLFLESDGFSDLQDELGVESSDAFLADLAAVVRLCLQPEDVAARIGDHGFAILAERANGDALEEAAQSVLQAYRNHIVEIGDRAFSASCSIGMAVIGRLATSSAEIMTRARKAQAEAAQAGDQLVTYRPKLTAVSSEDDDSHWVDRIKFALSNQDFYTVQQSIVDLDGEGEQLTENLTFMREEAGDHAPTKYQHIADRNDLAGTIDRNIIPGLIKTFVDADHRQVITLSNNSILDYNFPGWLADQMKSSCVDGSRIILQISAGAAQTNLKPAQRLMKELKPLGCQLSISQFDAGRRCRQLLDHLDVSFVKLQPELTANLTSNSNNQEAVGKIVDAAEPHGVSVIADEVADTSSLAVLWQCGVKLIAGAFLKESSQVIAQ